jgi:hypothetical protein
MTNEEVASMGMELYFPCCGKSICGGCIAYTPSGSPETIANVRFAILNQMAKQMKSWLEK